LWTLHILHAYIHTPESNRRLPWPSQQGQARHGGPPAATVSPRTSQKKPAKPAKAAGRTAAKNVTESTGFAFRQIVPEQCTQRAKLAHYSKAAICQTHEARTPLPFTRHINWRLSVEAEEAAAQEHSNRVFAANRLDDGAPDGAAGTKPAPAPSDASRRQCFRLLCACCAVLPVGRSGDRKARSGECRADRERQITPESGGGFVCLWV
jgi:hypothetical protein